MQEYFSYGYDSDTTDTETASTTSTKSERKPFRRAKRPCPKITDQTSTDMNDACKVCLTNKKTIILHPCGHFGICNSCSLRMYDVGYIKTSNGIKKQYYQNYLNRHVYYKCPFCNDVVHDLSLVYSI
jgi:hypothetical protein